VTVARSPVPAAVLSWRTFGQAYFAPLWLEETTFETKHREANIAAGLLSRLGTEGIDVDEAGLLHYIYAVLNGPDYRARYAHGLRHLFPRVPIARDPTTFAHIREVGAKLVALHLLEHPGLDDAAPRLDGNDAAVIEAPV
jgi:predicted helicase